MNDLRIKIIEGNKNQYGKDLIPAIVCEKCGNEIRLTNSEIGELILKIYENEERIYPRSKGFSGGKMFLKYLLGLVLTCLDKEVVE
ncbi:MAG: hypothetical protein QW228_07600 [Candidatus Aenigmatarchaeota archaeon]